MDGTTATIGRDRLSSWVSRLKEIWTMKRPMNSTEYAELAEKCRSHDLPRAEEAVAAAQARLDAQFFELQARGDEAGMQRLRRAVRDAKEHLDECKEALQRSERARDSARAAELAAENEQAWRKVDRSVGLVNSDAASIEATVNGLAEQLLAFGISLQQLHDELPEKPDSVESHRMLWNRDALALLVSRQLFAKTNGLIGSGGGGSPWEVSQGPNFARRVLEFTAVAMRKRPKAIPSTRPAA